MTYEEWKQIQKEQGLSLEELAQRSKIPLNIWEDMAGRDAHSQGIRERAAVYGSEVSKKQGEYTTQDYYMWPKEERIELIDGVIYTMEAPSFVHQHIITVFYGQLLSQFQKRSGKCVPVLSPVDVRLDQDDKTMIQPDVLILCDTSRIRRWGIMGAPDFVLEVISNSTRKKDYVKKLQKYSDAGVKEYWIIDPIRKVVVAYDLQGDISVSMVPLSGIKELAMYHGEIQIDLDEITKVIQDYPEE